MKCQRLGLRLSGSSVQLSGALLYLLVILGLLWFYPDDPTPLCPSLFSLITCDALVPTDCGVVLPESLAGTLNYSWSMWIHCVSARLLSCLTLCDPTDCSPPGSSVHGILQARICTGLPCPSPGDLPDPGIEPASLALQADSWLLSRWGSPWVC